MQTPTVEQVPAPPSPRGLPLVRSALRRRARETGTGTVFVVLHLVCELLVPVVLGLVVDRAVAPRDLAALLRWLGLLAVLFACLAGSAYVGYQRVRAAAELVALDLRGRLTARVLAPASPDDVPGGGALVSLATSDTRRIGSAAEVVAIGSSAVVTLAVGAVLLLRTSLPLGLLVLGGLPVVVLVVRLLARPLERRSGSEQEAVAAATAVASDLLAGLRVVKGLAAEPAAAVRYRRASREAMHGRVRAAALLGGTQSLLLAVNGVLLAAVAWVGARLVLRGELSIGQLVAAVGLAQFLVGPLQRLAWAAGQLAVVSASARRVAAVLDAPAEVADEGRTERACSAGAVVLRRVVAGRLHLDLELPAGAWTGVVADPADAAVLVDLLARRCDPEAGALLLDGVAWSDVPLADLRGAVLVADHDAVLLGGRLGDDLGSGAPVEPGVLAATGADDVLSTLPDGLDAQVGEDGRTLSGGQRQRLLLARAAAAEPRVLVLHDPTTAVDSATEAHVAQALRALRRDRTTVVLTTSPVLLGVCDRVVVVRDGRLVATGTSESLREHGAYRTAVLA